MKNSIKILVTLSVLLIAVTTVSASSVYISQKCKSYDSCMYAWNDPPGGPVQWCMCNAGPCRGFAGGECAWCICDSSGCRGGCSGSTSDGLSEQTTSPITHNIGLRWCNATFAAVKTTLVELNWSVEDLSTPVSGAPERFTMIIGLPGVAPVAGPEEDLPNMTDSRSRIVEIEARRAEIEGRAPLPVTGYEDMPIPYIESLDVVERNTDGGAPVTIMEIFEHVSIVTGREFNFDTKAGTVTITDR